MCALHHRQGLLHRLGRHCRAWWGHWVVAWRPSSPLPPRRPTRGGLNGTGARRMNCAFVRQGAANTIDGGPPLNHPTITSTLERVGLGGSCARWSCPSPSSPRHVRAAICGRLFFWLAGGIEVSLISPEQTTAFASPSGTYRLMVRALGGRSERPLGFVGEGTAAWRRFRRGTAPSFAEGGGCRCFRRATV